MADCALRYRISSAHDSTLVAQVHETRGWRKRPYFLRFEKLAGELHYHPEGGDPFRLTLEVDAGSLTCRDPSCPPRQQRRLTACACRVVLQAHQHPVLSFRSHQVAAKAWRGFLVEGTLCVRGITRHHRVNLVLTRAEGTGWEIEGDSLFPFSAFEIPPPSSRLGWIRTGDPVLLHWHLYAMPEGRESATE